MTRLLLAAALVVAAPFAIAAKPAEKPVHTKPFTYNELVRFDRVSDPAVSPDGRFAAYTLRETDFEANKGKRSLWMVATDGKTAPRQLTGSGNASDGRFGADGALYFLSSRSGSQQVWRLPPEGGEATAVTRLPLDVNAFVLAPSGDAIAVAMDVFPDAKTLTATKERLDKLEKNPSAGTLHTQLFIRHWDTWKNGTRSQLFTLPLIGGKASGEPVAVEPCASPEAVARSKELVVGQPASVARAELLHQPGAVGRFFSLGANYTF